MSRDFTIIGGGIVGLATAWALVQKHPNAKVTVLEKEPRWAAHQTGHNSGVIHSGIYYKPGSFKAEFCKKGRTSLEAFCREYDVPFEICGKLIVATEERELPALERLYQRGLEHGLKVRELAPAEAREIEPHVACIAAVQVPETGITDFKKVARKLAGLLEEAGCALALNAEVRGIVRDPGGGFNITTSAGVFRSRVLINCAGLHCDRIARMAGLEPPAKIVPFRGEYYELKEDRRGLVRNLIYPVPNPDFPFLGVHFTRMMDGTVHAGPNAVLALRREGYSWRQFSARDLAETLAYAGFWRMVRPNVREGLKEVWRSLSKPAFVKTLQRLIPEVQAEDVLPAGAGVRAQALTLEGGLVDDFLIMNQEGAIHVLNAPSPAATSSIEIGREIAGRVG